MGLAKWLAVVGLIVAVALFVPFIPQTQASGHFVGVQYQRTSVVSPSYYAFRCGSYVNSQAVAHIGSVFTGVYQLSKGYTFTCSYYSQ